MFVYWVQCVYRRFKVLNKIWWMPVSTKTLPKTRYALGGDLVDAQYISTKSPLLVYFLINVNGCKYSGDGK